MLNIVNYYKDKMLQDEYWKKWLIYGCAFGALLLAVSPILIYVFNVRAIIHPLMEALRNRGFSEDNIFAAQVSATFIIVSLVSFLSEGGEDVLWENTLQYSLLNPPVFNFISLAVYMIVDLAASAYVFFGNNESLYLLYFAVDIVLLIIMTYKMIGAFFARDSIKNELVKKYKKLDSDSNEKKEYLTSLKDKTVTFIIENRYKLIEENLDFLYEQNENTSLKDMMKEISKRSGNQYWIFLNKYGLGEELRDVSEDLCISLIKSNENVDLQRKLLTALYNSDSLNKQIEAFKKNTRKLHNFNIHMGEFHQIKDSVGMEGYFKYIEKCAQDGVKTINAELTACLSASIKLPIKPLMVAFNEKNMESFETVLKYMSNVRDNMEKVICDYICDCVLVKNYTDSFNERFNDEIKNRLSVEFVSESEKEIAQKMIEVGSKNILLTKSNIELLYKVCLSTIGFSER